MVSGAGGASLEQAYAACLRIASEHYENFPVASRLLPRALRPHVAAIYAFARTADDFADEPGRSDDDRLHLLELWHGRLHGRSQSCARSTDPTPCTLCTSRTLCTDDIFLALHDTIARFDLPVSLFDDLISAFAQDVTTSRYRTWHEVLDYCRRSANPVGRLVLRLTGQATPDRDEASDAICTALQLTNFWQDLAVDWRRGRLYVPADEWQRHDAQLGDLDAGVMSAPWRASIAAASDRTRRLFDRGRPLCDAVSGRLRYELRATWLGGVCILDALDRIGYDVFTRRPALTARDKLVVGWRTLAWDSTG